MSCVRLLLLALSCGVMASARAAVVFTEINYNPPESGVDNDEFIELTNIGSTIIDLTGATFTAGVVFTFPAGTTIAPNESILIAESISSLTATNTADKPGGGSRGHQLYNIPTTTQLFEWATGALNNNGESIVLEDQGGTQLANITYDENAPWPTAPDGTGPTLEIIDPFALNPYDTANWTASAANAGSPGVVAGIPEPASVMLLGLGAAGWLLIFRRPK